MATCCSLRPCSRRCSARRPTSRSTRSCTARPRRCSPDHPAIAQVHTIDREWKQPGAVAPGCAREWALLRGAARAPLRPARPSHRASARPDARAPAAAALRRSRASARSARRCGGAHFTHFYRCRRAPSATWSSRTSTRCAASACIPTRRPQAGAGAGRRGEAQRRRDCSREHGLAQRAFVQVHPGSRWLFKCWPRRAHGRAARPHRRRRLRGRRSPARPDERERAIVTATIAAARATATRARIVDLTGAAHAAGARGASPRGRARSSASIRRRCTSPRRWARRRSRCSARRASIAWGPWRVAQRVVASDAHPCRPCGLDGCGGGKVSECLTTLPVDRVHAAFAALLAQTDSGAR